MKKFTVIITHYNQMGYIKEAIMSILNQTYRNIELIIADDCSPQFDKKKVEKFIKNNNKKKYEYKVLDSKKNVGTVKNLNNALKQATGDYILFFAADDKMYDENVMEKFVREFDDKNKNVITTQCLLYDDNMDELYGKFVNVLKAERLNKKTSRDIYASMAYSCIYGSGGTAYRKEVFEKHGLFNEEYKFVEDWSYYLKILREKEKIYYSNFKTLCHRNGGISHSEYNIYTIPPHVRQYYIDIVNIYKNEVFNYFDMFTLREKYKIMNRCHELITHYSIDVPELKNYDMINNERKKNKKLNLYWNINLLSRNFKRFIIDKIKIICIKNRIVLFTFITWLLSNIFITNFLEINNYNILFTIYIISYFVIYAFVHIAYKFLKCIKYRKTGGLNVQ